MISYTALRARYIADRSAREAVAGLTNALTAIGWRAVGDPTPQKLAGELIELVDACVEEHHDTSWLISAVARLLRDRGPLLDGGLPPVEAYEPASFELLDRYVRGAVVLDDEPFGMG